MQRLTAQQREAAGVAKLDVVTIAPARHFVMLDQPERFQKALDGFLARV